MVKKNVALYQQILTKSELRGPTYFFPLFNKAYCQSEQSEFNLYYFLKTDNLELIQARARNDEFNVKNIVFLPERNHRFKRIHESIDFIRACLKHRIDLVQIASFTLEDPFHQLRAITRLRWLLRVKTVLTITYNGHSQAFFQNYIDRFQKYTDYHKLFKQLHWSGVLSWYDDVFRFVSESQLFGKSPVVSTVENRFCDMEIFKPTIKEKIIYWAGALEVYKHPEYFLEAIARIKKDTPLLLENWKFILLGSGPLTQSIIQYVADNDLSSHIEVLPSQPDYYRLVNKSMAHVATQELDHFPSLVINEAMAGGCAILATNVGRVGLYVNDGENGYLSSTEDAEGIRTILHRFLSLPDNERNQMMQESRNLCETHHSADQFIHQIDQFWGKVLG